MFPNHSESCLEFWGCWVLTPTMQDLGQDLAAQEEDIVFSNVPSRIGIFNVKIIRWDLINVPYCT